MEVLPSNKDAHYSGLFYDHPSRHNNTEEEKGQGQDSQNNLDKLPLPHIIVSGEGHFDAYA
jgi:hypothetical protein